MMRDPNRRYKIRLDNTRFIFATNFSGDPAKSKYGSKEMVGQIIIPDVDVAQQLISEGFNVKVTQPAPGKEMDFVPTYHIKIKISFKDDLPLDHRLQPHVYLVSQGCVPQQLTPKTVRLIDEAYVLNVNAVLSVYYGNTERPTLYVDTMYVEQDAHNDPYRDMYWNGFEQPEPGMNPPEGFEDDALPFN